MDQDISSSEQRRISDERSFIVDRPTRTAAKHGLSRQDVDRLKGCLHFMEFNCRPGRSRLSWVTVNKGSSRDLISAVQKRVTRLQKEHSVPAYNVTVFENSGGLHAHIVFISDRAGEIVAALV